MARRHQYSMPMKVTIHDVARRAGVSIKTVSRVINRETGVRAKTIEKVRAAIDELNYQPNVSARSLAGTRSYVIGFVYDNANAYYIIDMQSGILSACRESGYELLIHPCDARSPKLAEEIQQMVRHSKAAGLVLTPPLSENPAIMAMLKARNVRYVRIISGSSIHEDDSPCVAIDDYKAAYNITRHLLDSGRCKIAFLCGDPAHKSSIDRLDGYKAALQEQGLPLHDEWIVPGDYSFDSGVRGTRHLLSLSQQPDAIFACNDEIASGALFHAQQQGIKVPQQLAVAGFEDSPLSRQSWPSLTTAHQPTVAIARQATELLIQSLRPNTPTPEPVLIEPQLVIRDSTRPV